MRNARASNELITNWNYYLFSIFSQKYLLLIRLQIWQKFVVCQIFIAIFRQWIFHPVILILIFQIKLFKKFISVNLIEIFFNRKLTYIKMVNLYLTTNMILVLDYFLKKACFQQWWRLVSVAVCLGWALFLCSYACVP